LTPLRQEFLRQFGLDLTPVGTITAERGLRLMRGDGSHLTLPTQAFDHFHRPSR
jgi:hypothetical protein